MKSKFTRSLSTLILGVFTLLLINSCKKEFLTTPLEDLTSSKITKNGVSIESINFKTFKSEVDFNKLGNLKTTFEKGSEFNSRILLDADAKSNIEIDLSSVKKLTVKGKISYVFSIKSSSPRAVSFSNLTIEQNVSKDSLKAFMTVYTPKKEWIKAYHNKETLSFNGSIEFQKIDLNQIKDVKQGIGSSITTNSTSAWTQVCLSYTVYEHVEVSCAGTGSANHTYKNRDACDDNGTPLGPTIELQARQVTECSTIADPNYDPSNPPSGGGTGDPTNPDTYGGSTTPTPPSGYNPCDSGGEQSTINSINGVQVLVAGDSPCDPNQSGGVHPISELEANVNILAQFFSFTQEQKNYLLTHPNTVSDIRLSLENALVDDVYKLGIKQSLEDLRTGNTLVMNPENNINIETNDQRVGGDDPTVYPEYQDQDPWPTIKTIIPEKDFIKYREDINCFVLSTEQIAKLGYEISKYDALGSTYNINTAEGVSVTEAKKAAEKAAKATVSSEQPKESAPAEAAENKKSAAAEAAE